MMDFFTRVQSSFMLWKHGIPLPSTAPSTKFQSWYTFDPIQKWIPFVRQSDTNPNDSTDSEPNEASNESESPLALLTWNIDVTSPRTEGRVTDIITYITGLGQIDIVFLQEVSKLALQQILKDDRVRELWLSSQYDNTEWGNQSFTTVTLLSKARFTCGQGMQCPTIGPIGKIKFPSHFARDALCCDISVPSHQKPTSSTTSALTRIRLVNVHLDSLPITPSHRPQQISIVSSLLRSAGQGLIAGDFNPVLDEDVDLLEKNDLVDAWTSLRPGESGFTWGLDGEQPFPPIRLDKVGTIGLRAHRINTLEPKRLEGPQHSEGCRLWSDHHGLLYYFSPTDE
ncbi:endonuclease/exonuclease/phosphatase family protein [Penicillium malachiteum]|uniref:Endonuclease/exonuclease/phosphatase family protein n=1 Tax=Penicillium malachiteum TaxID=1324776 RepID=A0AAD6MV31_9EURO|nr:endonuclease/exonuclease/phosphatase family protein [Penicillium malachiteum]